MSIVFGGDVGIREDTYANIWSAFANKFSQVKDGLLDNFSRLTGPSSGFNTAIDRENSYVDDGFSNVPGTSFLGSGNIGAVDDIQKRRIISQAPQATVFIKKKLFNSLRDENDSRFMDSGEKLFMRSSKLLFERKCSQIAAYEAMTKLERLIEEESELDYSRLDSFIDSLEGNTNTILDASTQNFKDVANDPDRTASQIDEAFNSFTSVNDSATEMNAVIEALRELAKKSRQGKQAVHTSWVIDTSANTDRAGIGRGTGVIELTLIDTIRTNLSLEYGDLGGFSISIQDPYNFTMINNVDIELALNSARQEIHSEEDPAFISPFRGPQEVLEEARQKEEELRKLRENRLSSVTFGALDPTNPLSGSDLAEIIFEIQPGSQADHKVTGRFSSSTETFNSTNFRIVTNQLPSEYRLTVGEDNLVEQIFNLLELYIVKINRISEQDIGFAGNNDEKRKNAEYARRQLRKWYLGKHIIQPMDSIHVYLRGNTFFDNQVLGPLGALLNSSPFVQSFVSGDNLSDSILKEEMRQFNITNIPVNLYRKLRTDSMLRNAGTHVFGGLVSRVNQSYSAARGEYTLQVSGQNNLKWLNLSRVNVKPSLDQPRGVLEDPLTPLDFEIDEATGLVKNANLSAENFRKLRKMYYKNGVYKGKQVSAQNLKQDVIIIGNTAFPVIQHAPGMVYKWKEGVISATQSVNLRTSLSSGISELDQLRRNVGVTITKSPFANLDIADVISLLITGFPHNYESFVLNAQSVGTYTVGSDDNRSESFFNSLQDITKTTNKALGNFQPIKPITVSREEMGERLKLQVSLRDENSELSRLQSQIAELQDQVNQLSQSSPALRDSLSKTLGLLKKRERQLNVDLGEKIRDAESKGLRVYADDIVLDGTSTAASDSDAIKEEDQSIRLISNLSQIRTQVDTKLNQDKNLFIVSDEYDKDLDIQAFVTELESGEVPIWNSEYQHPIDTCINAAKVIDLEFFCDTQGHIQLRPPQYNKIPISLLAKMLLLSNDKGIDLLPPFVRALFKTRKEALIKSQEIIQIDLDINNLLLYREVGALEATNRGDFTASFSRDFGILVTANDTVEDQDITSVAKAIQALKNTKARQIGTKSIPDNSDEFAEIEKEVGELNTPSTPNVNVRRRSIYNKILQLSSNKQRVEETLAKIEKNEVKTQVENGKIGDLKDSVSTEQLRSVLEPFGNLLEDDSNDFLGPGSAGRFIIYDEQIMSSDFKESDEGIYCRVDVTGQQDLLGESAGTIGQIPLLWAGATDFDLWRQYGWKSQQAVSKPFFKDAETQCAPYALMLLSRQRKNVVTGSITVAGNEYYQLGDVVYINSRDTLYYVNSVSHNFSYSGNSFTTTLDLRYGHPLGEFIPTPLDVIGKNIIRNQRKFNTSFVYRSTSDNSIGRLAGVVMFASTESSDVDDATIQLIEGDLGAVNLNELRNALLVISKIKDNPQFNQVEIRGFIRDESDSEKVKNRMNAVKEWMLLPISGFDSDGKKIVLDTTQFPAVSDDIIKTFDDDLDPILMPKSPINQSEDQDPLDEGNKGRTPFEESYNFDPDPDDVNSEFPTIEIVLTFKE